MNNGVHPAKIGSRPLIIPIFIMNSGCPHRCIFCNQKITAGNHPPQIEKRYFEKEVNAYLTWNNGKTGPAEIAFYGGSFTGIDIGYQEKLLTWAQSYIQNGLVQSVRISTRPDYINPDILAFLRKYDVTTVEIGAQSFVDDVLLFARRGHNAAATEAAVRLLKAENFQISLHLMAGLPQDTKEGFIHSLEKTIELRPDMARIHPVVVFAGTELASEFERGNYSPLQLAEAVDLCALAYKKLSAAGISVIRTGLHWTKEMEDKGAVLAGPLHPAFGSLVLSAIVYEKTLSLLEKIPAGTGEICFQLNDRDVSNFRGISNSNINSIKKLYPDTAIKVRTSAEQKRGVLSAVTGEGFIASITVPGIT